MTNTIDNKEAMNPSIMGVADVEKNGSDSGHVPSINGDARSMKTSKHGIPLVPQPTDDPDEPLNWSFSKKHTALAVLALDSFLLKATATLISPGAHALAAQFGTAASTATYIGSAPTITSCIGPFVWIPLSHRIGRRPVLLIGVLMTMCFALGVARSESYAQALTCRMFMGLCASAGLCIAPAAISDMFFLHEKGKRMGVYTFMLVCAPYAGGIAGGSVQFNPHLGWRWSMYVAAILYGALFALMLLFVPETIFERECAAEESKNRKSLERRLLFRTPKNPLGHSWGYIFSRPLRMWAYPTVVLPSIWYGIAGMTEVCNTAGLALNFGKGSRWNFNVQQVGFCFTAGLIGAAIGEFFGGPICDFVAKRSLKRGLVWKAEKLLVVCWSGLFAIVSGLLLYGFELQWPTTWSAALAGLLLHTFGQEVLVTCLLTYLTDCYPEDAAEVTIVFQVCTNLIAWPQPFYVPQWIAKPYGPKVAYIVFALLPIVTFPFCIGLFMWKGEQIRHRGTWLGKNAIRAL